MEIDGYNGTTEPDGRKIETGMDYIVRRARLSDLERLVDFTLAEAVEAEGSSKSRESTPGNPGRVGGRVNCGLLGPGRQPE